MRKAFWTYAVICAVIGLLIISIMSASGVDTNSLSNNVNPSSTKSMNAVKLPEPRTDGGLSIERVLKERRSIRSLGQDGLSLDEVSQLLWAAQGVTDDKGHRTAPSAVAKYPLEVYLLAENVAGLAPGVYHYSPQSHSLTLIKDGWIDDYYDASAGARFNDWMKTAPAIFVITGVFSRMDFMPGRDLSHFVYIEAGAAAENLLLEVVSLNLASTFIGAFDANKLKELLGLSGGEEPVAILPVGKKS